MLGLCCMYPSIEWIQRMWQPLYYLCSIIHIFIYVILYSKAPSFIISFLCIFSNMVSEPKLKERKHSGCKGEYGAWFTKKTEKFSTVSETSKYSNKQFDHIRWKRRFVWSQRHNRNRDASRQAPPTCLLNLRIFLTLHTRRWRLQTSRAEPPSRRAACSFLLQSRRAEPMSLKVEPLENKFCLAAESHQAKPHIFKIYFWSRNMSQAEPCAAKTIWKMTKKIEKI